ncbi:programmed cell death protein 6-like isoform X2 [Limulus polyphemus]|uniref:Peflin n=1 Tax=Limulus polyphemus TaxID=6850 RepID=A0ABM1TR68_LIMPO|nr:programmed cell death protein 6-like isoform X2 [Limulus polyphemus]
MSWGYGQQYHHQLQGPPSDVPLYIWEWFKAVDQEGNGSISASELQRALMNGNWSPFNEETCRLMIGMFDQNHTGTIEIHEFALLWNYIQQWKQCFDSFDRDRSGNIDAQELHQALHTFGYRISMNFCKLVMTKFDRTGCQAINLDDFIQICVMLKSLTDGFRAKDTDQTDFKVRGNQESMKIKRERCSTTYTCFLPS